MGIKITRAEYWKYYFIYTFLKIIREKHAVYNCDAYHTFQNHAYGIRLLPSFA